MGSGAHPSAGRLRDATSFSAVASRRSENARPINGMALFSPRATPGGMVARGCAGVPDASRSTLRARPEAGARPDVTPVARGCAASGREAPAHQRHGSAFAPRNARRSGCARVREGAGCPPLLPVRPPGSRRAARRNAGCARVRRLGAESPGASKAWRRFRPTQRPEEWLREGASPAAAPGALTGAGGAHRVRRQLLGTYP